MLEWESIEIFDHTTTTSLYDNLATLGAKLILSTLEGLNLGTLKPIHQPTDGVTYAKKLEKNEGNLDFSLPAVVLDRVIRGLVPQISVWASYEGLRIKIHQVEPSLFELDDFEFGSIVQKDGDLYIVCGKGSLKILVLQPEGGKIMDVDAFIRGYAHRR